MKYKTKKQRLLAITDAYRRITGKKMFTAKEVAEWAISCWLFPVPTRGEEPETCTEWERRLEAVQVQNDTRIPSSGISDVTRSDFSAD